MKTPFIIVLLLALIGYTSCRKSNNSSPASATRYRVSRINDVSIKTGSSADNIKLIILYNIAYTVDNKLSDIAFNYAYYEPYTNTTPGTTGGYKASYFFNSSDNSYNIHYNTNTQSDAIKLNGAGQVISVLGNHYAQFSYDTTSLLVNSVQQSTNINSATNFYYNYIWADGNLAMRINSISGDTGIVSYYTDRPCALGDGITVQNFLDFGNTVIKTKNLTRSIVSTYSKVYCTYTFDTGGRISTANTIQTDSFDFYNRDTLTHNYTFTYTTY